VETKSLFRIFLKGHKLYFQQPFRDNLHSFLQKQYQSLTKRKEKTGFIIVNAQSMKNTERLSLLLQ